MVNTFELIQKKLKDNELMGQQKIEINRESKLNFEAEVRKKGKVFSQASDFRLPCGGVLITTETYVNPSLCKIWEGNNRLEENRSDSSLEELKQALKAQGQLIPGFVRPLEDDPEYKYEVIYGTRRFSACKAIDIEFFALCGEIDDKNALLLMDAENNARKDLSVYEKARSYQQWLSKKIFKDRGELAKHLGVSAQWVSRTQAILKLPEEVLDAFVKKSDISVWWASELLKVAKHGPETEKKMMEMALKKPSTIKEPKAVYEYLIKGASPQSEIITKKEKTNTEKMCVKDKRGNLICSIREASNGKVQATFEKPFGSEKIKEIVETALVEENAWEY